MRISDWSSDVCSSDLEEAFVQRGRGIVETVYPDVAERRRLYQYGFTPLVGRRFEAVAPQIRTLIEEAEAYGEAEATARIDVFEAIGDLLAADRGFGFRVRGTDTDQALLERWADVLGWWMDEPESLDPDADALRGWQRFVAEDRKRGVSGKGVSVRVDLGGG